MLLLKKFMLLVPFFLLVVSSPTAHSEDKVEEPVEFIRESEEYISFPKVSDDDERSYDEMEEKFIPRINNNPYANEDPQKVKGLLMERVDGTVWERVFEQNPKLLNFLADLYSDDEALVSFFSMFYQINKFQRVFYCFILIFLFNWYLRIVLPKKLPPRKRLIKEASFYFGTFMANTLSVYFIFYDELSPIINLAWKHFGFF